MSLPAELNQFENMSLATMAEVYNAAQELLGREDRIKKFASRALGMARLDKARQELLKMHGYAMLTETEDSFFWDTTNPKAKRAPREKREATVVGAQAARGRESMVDLGSPITILVANPKQPKSRSFQIFNLYRNGMTGADYIEAVVNFGESRRLALSTLRWDLEHEFIKIGR